MHDSRPLRQAWPWNAGYRRLYLGVPTPFGLLATAALYPHHGVHALCFLATLGGGLLLAPIAGERKVLPCSVRLAPPSVGRRPETGETMGATT